MSRNKQDIVLPSYDSVSHKPDERSSAWPAGLRCNGKICRPYIKGARHSDESSLWVRFELQLPKDGSHGGLV